MDNKKWFNYIIFDKNLTYVGSTVNLDKRIRQHNRELKGGAKYTAGGKWEYYCIIYNIDNKKTTALSEEWHIKWARTKINTGKNVYDKRKKSLEWYYPQRPDTYYPYTYIFFINEKFSEYLPDLPDNCLVMVEKDLSMENIENKISELI